MLILAVMLIGINVFAQENETKNNQDKGKDNFIMEAASGGMMEVQLGNLAKDNAKSEEVKQFGERMVRDHSKANDELKDIAQKDNITLPDKLMEKHQKMVDKFSKMSGEQFDKAYMRMMVQDHRDDVEKFEKASKNESNGEVKNWVKKTLPVLKYHLQLAKETNGKMNKSDLDDTRKKDTDNQTH